VECYWNETGTPSESIRGANLDGSGGINGGIEFLFAPADGTDNGFHFNPLSSRVYVINNGATTITSFNLDGSLPQPVASGRTFLNYVEAAVPEPSSSILVAISAVALAVRRRW